MAEVAVKKSELLYMTYFRAIAILFIIAGHTFEFGDWYLDRTERFLFRWGTFYFVFIAGFLFQYLSYKYDYKEFLKRKFLNVILPYLCVIFPAALVYAITPTYPENILYYMDSATRFIYPFFFGLVVNGPTWFIGMIVIYFLLSPLFLKLIKKKYLWYAVLIISILGTIFINRPVVHPPKIATMPSLLRISASYLYYFLATFLWFASAWLLGMQLCVHTEKYPEFIKKYKKIILSIISVLLVGSFVFLIFISHTKAFGISKILTTLLIFTLLYLYWEKLANCKIVDKTLKILANYSFGIFFIHMPILYLIRYHTIVPKIYDYIHKPSGLFNIAVYCTLEFIMTILLSLAVLASIKFILTKLNVKHTRWFIGV